MKKLLLAATLAVSLGGCATTGGIGGVTQAQIDQAIHDVQATARQLCGFVPIAATIIGIFDSGLGSTVDVAREICAAVTAPTAALAADLPPGKKSPPVVVRVRNVEVKGYFVGKAPPKRK